MRAPRPLTLISGIAVATALVAVLVPSPSKPSLAAHPLQLWEPPEKAIEDVEVGRDRRPGWTLDLPGHLRFRGTVPDAGQLVFAFAVDPPRTTVTVRVRVATALDTTETLREEVWNGPFMWRERRVDLERFAGSTVDLEIAAEGHGTRFSLARPTLLGRADGPTRPNVVLYVVDCLRADHVGAYGYPRPTTPELDRLAADGVVFEDVQACASWTKPAVGCLFTSLYPTLHGARTVDDTLDPTVPTLAEAFRAQGYSTAAWVANPFVSANLFGLARGFERVVQILDKPDLKNINDLKADAADITERVVPWLEANADRRFFLYLHSLDLHAQYRRRPPFDAVFLSPHRRGLARQIDLYDNELAANDHELGRLFSALRRTRLYDRTIIVVTADHGEEFEEHSFTRHGHTLFAPALHVPLVVKLPFSASRGRRAPDLASVLDIAPTLLDAAGLSIPRSFQGRSLFPKAMGRPVPARAFALAEQLSPKEALYAGRDARFKYIHQILPEPQELLFDAVADPGEMRNLLPNPPAEATPLMTEVLKTVQMGQAGYHISISETDSEARYVMRAETRARFGDVQRFAITAEETLTIDPSHRRLTYAFRAGEQKRHIVVRTDPLDAAIQIDFERNGRTVPSENVGLGTDGRPSARPITVEANALRVDLDRAAELLASGGPPVRIWYVPSPLGARKAAIDPDLEQRLRTLGYLP